MGFFEFEIVTVLFLGLLWGYLGIPRIIWDCGPIDLLFWSVIDILWFNGRARTLARLHAGHEIRGAHTAILICHTKRIPFLPVTDDNIYACGVDLVISHLLAHRLPFRVYECYTPEDARRVMADRDAESLWIFGHGLKSGILFGRDVTLRYDEMRDAPRKTFIGQFHCNADGGLSLADYLSRDGGSAFVRDGYRCTHQNRRDIRMLLSVGSDLFGTPLGGSTGSLPTLVRETSKPMAAVEGV
jgi:hypothetical protein